MIGNGLSNYLSEIGYEIMKIDSSNFKVHAGEHQNSIHKKLLKINNFDDVDIVINCIGIVKQAVESFDKEAVFYLNSSLPSILANIASIESKKFIHISTDCVFSGKVGNRNESDYMDATDIYGKSKALGEKVHEVSVVIRTSTIGIELRNYHGLLSWYLSQIDPVPGFVNAIYNGVSLAELSKSINALLQLNIKNGLFNVSSVPVSKFDLLSLMHIVGLGPKVFVRETPIIDRTLNDDKFRRVTNMRKPNWIEMLSDIQKEVANYDVKM